jgi:hypothetical protein
MPESAGASVDRRMDRQGLETGGLDAAGDRPDDACRGSLDGSLSADVAQQLALRGKWRRRDREAALPPYPMLE